MHRHRTKSIVIFVLTVIMLIMIVGSVQYYLKQNKQMNEMEITFAHFQGEGDAMYHSIENAIYLYEKENPNVKIRQEYYTTDAYSQKVEEWSEQSKMRDITMVLGTMIPKCVEEESILSLTDAVQEYKLKGKIDENAFKELSYEGEIYGIPWEQAYYGFILYNDEIFKEVGIEEFPEDLDGFMEACNRLYSAGYIPMGVGNKQKWGLDSLLFSAFVNNYVGNDWYDDILACNGEASFLDKEFMYALEDFQKLGRVGAFNYNFASLNNEQRGAMYQNREVAMISAGNWECRSTAELVPEIAENTKAATWPVGKKAVITDSLVSSSAWGMAVGSRVEEEKISYIMDFIDNYICSEEFGRIMAEEQGVFTPWDLEYDSSTINIITQRVEVLAQENVVQTCLNWDSTLPIEVKVVYQQGLQDIILGLKNPEMVAKEMQKAYEQVCEEK